MDLAEKVKNILERLDIVDPEVKILEGFGYQVMARVVSSSFEGMSDGDRQNLVWGNLLRELTDREQEWVEFIFTKAPSELDPSEVESKVSVTEAKP